MCFAGTIGLFACVVSSIPAVATQPGSEEQQAQTASPPAKKLASEHLPNPVRLHEKVISGGLPEDEQAFQELADLGIKTIISVDGMTPDVAMAKKFGLRYVHLPHGYDGIPSGRVQELAKAVRDLEGPIYIHCHHGKHRSPTAAAVACVAAGLMPADQAEDVLRLAGTNPGYRGLYQTAHDAHALPPNLLDQLQVDFKEVQAIPPMAEAMVHLSHAYDHLQSVAEAGWRTPKDHPDLTPAHEALLLRELFTELLRTETVQSEPTDFQDWLRESEQAAQRLEDELSNWQPTTNAQQPPAKFSQDLKQISSACKACHVKYRDRPLNEK